jgi:hypothetical protein
MIRASAGTAGCCQTPGVPHEFGDGDVSVASVTSEKLDCWGPDSIYLQDVPPIPHFNLSRTSTQAKCQSPELCMESAPNLLICHHLVTRCHTSSLKEPCIYNIYIQIQWHICTYLYQSAPLNMEFLLTRITTASTAPGDHWHIVHRGHPTDKTEGDIWRHMET